MTLAGIDPLQPRKTLISNPDSHSPRYSRVESGVFAARDSLLGDCGFCAAVAWWLEGVHAVTKTRHADRKPTRMSDNLIDCRTHEGVRPTRAGRSPPLSEPTNHSLLLVWLRSCWLDRESYL